MSCMRNTYRTWERPTIRLVWLSIKNPIVDFMHKHHTTYKYNISAPNPRVWRITQLAKLSFNHPSVVLTAHVFQFCIKSTSPWGRPREVAQVTRNFGGVTTATYACVIPVANLRLLEGETNYLNTLQCSTECFNSLELTTVMRMISVFFVNTLENIYNCSHRNVSGRVYI